MGSKRWWPSTWLGWVIICLLCRGSSAPATLQPAHSAAEATSTLEPTAAPIQPETADLSVFSDALAPGWEDWSWNTNVDFSAASLVHSGTDLISVGFSAAWAGLSLHAPTPISTGGYISIDFWAYGGAGGTQISFYSEASDSGGSSPLKDLTFPAGVWTHFTIPLSELGNPSAACVPELDGPQRSNPANLLPG